MVISDDLSVVRFSLTSCESALLSMVLSSFAASKTRWAEPANEGPRRVAWASVCHQQTFVAMSYHFQRCRSTAIEVALRMALRKFRTDHGDMEGTGLYVAGLAEDFAAAKAPHTSLKQHRHTALCCRSTAVEVALRMAMRKVRPDQGNVDGARLHGTWRAWLKSTSWQGV